MAVDHQSRELTDLISEAAGGRGRARSGRELQSPNPRLE